MWSERLAPTIPLLLLTLVKLIFSLYLVTINSTLSPSPHRNGHRILHRSVRAPTTAQNSYPFRALPMLSVPLLTSPRYARLFSALRTRDGGEAFMDRACGMDIINERRKGDIDPYQLRAEHNQIQNHRADPELRPTVVVHDLHSPPSALCLDIGFNLGHGDLNFQSVFCLPLKHLSNTPTTYT